MIYLLGSTFSLVGFFRPQAQRDLDRIPLWIWILVIFLVILVGIIWTLREEEEHRLAAGGSAKPDTLPEPVVTAPESILTQPAPPPTPVETPPLEKDNLTKVSGIGPKTQRELNERGIYTFAQLAAINPDYLTELVNELRWGAINRPETWPAQARRLDEAKGNT